MLKSTFIDLISRYSQDSHHAEDLWAEIRQNYTRRGRHYHNLQHLENLLEQLIAVKEDIQDWDTILFTLYYHDVVYNARKGDNEEKSAILAEKRLRTLGYPEAKIQRCKEQILATKGHVISEDRDTNYFTDADLSILGQAWDLYAGYAKAVRKEYAMYPDLLYKPGRKKVLAHFLAMPRIFKTSYFFDRFESAARINLQREMTEL